MGLKDYMDKDDTSPINQFIKAIDPLFNFFIYLEFVFKFIAMGFSGRHSYLMD